MGENYSKKIMDSVAVINALFIIGFLGIVWLLIFGNLSGNLGFAVDTKGYNDTQSVIQNITEGATTFYGFSVTWFTITAIVLLIIILFGLLLLVMKISKMSGGGGKGGDSGFSGY